MKLEKLFSVENKIVVVTGGVRGMGAMIAQGFLENGADVFITSRDALACEKAEANFNQLACHGGKCKALIADLSSLDGIHRFADRLKEETDKIDVLVNNAGASLAGSFESFTEEGWDSLLDINLKSPFFVIQCLYPLLKLAGTRENPSRIINIASLSGLLPPPPPADFGFSYGVSKAGLVHLTKHLSVRFSKDDINVNGIAPYFFKSDLVEKWTETHGITMDNIADANPRGRIGLPEDIAGTTLYLASMASAWVTGITIKLDGGQVTV